MATFGLIDYDAASPEVRAISDEIRATRHTDWLNNFWQALAHDTAHLKRRSCTSSLRVISLAQKTT